MKMNDQKKRRDLRGKGLMFKLIYPMGNALAEHFPQMNLHLAKSGVKALKLKSASEYLTKVIATSLGFIFFFVSMFIIGYFKRGDVSLYSVLILGFIITLASFLLQVNYPKYNFDKHTKELEKDLIPAINKMIVHLKAGMSLKATFNEIAKDKSLGRMRIAFADLLRKVRFNKSMEKSLSEMLIENPSQRLGDVIAQLIHAKTHGEKIVEVLESKLKILKAERQAEIEGFGHKLKGLSTIYLMAEVVFPSLIAIAVIAGAALTPVITKPIFFAFIIYELVFNQFFIGLIKSSKPTLLKEGEVVGSKNISFGAQPSVRWYKNVASMYNFIPKKKLSFMKEIEYVYPNINYEEALGKNLIKIFFTSIIISLAVIFGFNLSSKILVFVFPAMFLTTHAFWYAYIGLKATRIGERVEKVLPDFLILYAEGLTAGLSQKKALRECAQKELGPLKDHLERVLREVNFQHSMADSLMRLSDRIKSKKFEKAIALIVSSMSRGGRLTEALHEQAEQFQEENAQKRMIDTNTASYRWFVFFGTVLAKPAFLALSVVIFLIVMSLSGDFVGAGVSNSNLMLFSEGSNVDESFLIMFNIGFLIVSSIMSSFVQGNITKGSSKAGLMFIPVQAIASIILFFAILHVAKVFFGSQFGLV